MAVEEGGHLFTQEIRVRMLSSNYTTPNQLAYMNQSEKEFGSPLAIFVRSLVARAVRLRRALVAQALDVVFQAKASLTQKQKSEPQNNPSFPKYL
jgi:hypothetical protein